MYSILVSGMWASVKLFFVPFLCVWKIFKQESLGDGHGKFTHFVNNRKLELDPPAPSVWLPYFRRRKNDSRTNGIFKLRSFWMFSHMDFALNRWLADTCEIYGKCLQKVFICHPLHSFYHPWPRGVWTGACGLTSTCPDSYGWPAPLAFTLQHAAVIREPSKNAVSFAQLHWLGALVGLAGNWWWNY